MRRERQRRTVTLKCNPREARAESMSLGPSARGVAYSCFTALGPCAWIFFRETSQSHQGRVDQAHDFGRWAREIPAGLFHLYCVNYVMSMQ